MWKYLVQLKMDILSDPAMPLLDMHPREISCICTRRHVWWECSDRLSLLDSAMLLNATNDPLGRPPSFESHRGDFDHCCREAHRTPLLQEPSVVTFFLLSQLGPLHSCSMSPRFPQLHSPIITLPCASHGWPLLSYPGSFLSPLRHKTQRDCWGHTDLIGLRGLGNIPGFCPLTGWQMFLLFLMAAKRSQETMPEVQKVNTQWSKFQPLRGRVW